MLYTVSGTLLLAFPATVTTTGPDVAVGGTMAEMDVSDHNVADPTTPLKRTVLEPCVAEKLDPVIVTVSPRYAVAVLREVMAGGGITVNGKPLLVVPPTVTVIGPVVEPAGTGTSISVDDHAEGAARVPLNLMVDVPCVAPNSVPVTWTLAFHGAGFGVAPVIAGGGRGATIVESYVPASVPSVRSHAVTGKSPTDDVTWAPTHRRYRSDACRVTAALVVQLNVNLVSVTVSGDVPVAEHNRVDATLFRYSLARG
jgi:hypothetical protein